MKTFPTQESEQLQRSFCLTRGWGKSHVLHELLEEFHKLKAVTSKQLTSATNPSEKILSNCCLCILSCGYLKSTVQRVCTQRVKHTVTTAQLREMHFQRRAEGIYCSGISVSCLTFSLCATHSQSRNHHNSHSTYTFSPTWHLKLLDL